MAICEIDGGLSAEDAEEVAIDDLKKSLTSRQVRGIIGMMAQILDDVRKAIQASAKSRYRIWKETGISQPQLSKLMRGERGLSIEALERLAECLGLEIVIRPKDGQEGK